MVDALELLLRRRSVAARQLGEPGPASGEIDLILTAAARVPDHKKLVPWRFIMLEGDGRARFGKAVAAVAEREEGKPLPAERRALEEGRFVRAPLVVVAVSRIVENPQAPDWEQQLSCGAACQSLTLAANALGYATNWITEWPAYSTGVQALLRLAGNERIAGFIYIGTPKLLPPDRDRPTLADIVSRWVG